MINLPLIVFILSLQIKDRKKILHFKTITRIFTKVQYTCWTNSGNTSNISVHFYFLCFTHGLFAHSLRNRALLDNFMNLNIVTVIYNSIVEKKILLSCFILTQNCLRTVLILFLILAILLSFKKKNCERFNFWRKQ